MNNSSTSALCQPQDAGSVISMAPGTDSRRTVLTRKPGMLSFFIIAPFREVLMKIVKSVSLLATTTLLAGGIASAVQEGASIEKGKMLFQDPALGTTGKSCSSCHPGGKGLEKSGSRQDLTDIINGCITIPLKGRALDPKSIEMESLVLYIKSLGSK